MILHGSLEDPLADEFGSPVPVRAGLAEVGDGSGSDEGWGWGGVDIAVPTEEQKRRWEGEEDKRERERRLCRAWIWGSKVDIERVKFTSHAPWMMCVASLRLA